MKEIVGKMQAVFDRAVAGNPAWAWALAAAAAAATVLVLMGIRRAVARRARALAEGSGRPLHQGVAELLSRVSPFLILLAGAYAGTLFLHLSPRVEAVLRSALVVLLLVQAGIWASVLIGFWLRRRLEESKDAGRSTAVLMLSFGGKLAVWTLVLLLSLENVGVDVTALVAGLGVGGIAVALAVQNVLGDLLSSVSIALDRPFELGDFIIVGDLMGTVEHIGLKTTRVRSLSGEQIVFGNKDLLESRIRNFKRMKERRVLFTFGVTYQTPPEKLEAIPGMVREIIEALPDVRFDRAHFKSFGDFALLFEAVYYVRRPEVGVFMDRQQTVNLELCRRFAREGIEFAYPTQTVYLRVEPAAGGRAQTPAPAST